MTRPLIIAIDGPSGAGKSTLGQMLARKLGLLYIDTGSMYRAVALAVIESTISETDDVAVGSLAGRVEIDLAGNPESLSVSLNGQDVTERIRDEDVTNISSIISTIPAVRRAMVLLLKGVAQAEEMHNAEVHSAANAHKVPSVIRLLAYRHIPQQSRALSRKNILLRDRNTCQFCGRVFPSSELTLDHVVPRSRGGRSSWENLVACCYRCNNSKGDRTPEEAGLKLARRPRPFTLHTSRQLMRMIGHRDERWRKYLFY